MNKAETRLQETIASLVYNPLGFVKFAFPWGEPGVLQHHTGPDAWQMDFLTQLGQKARGEPDSAVRFATVSGNGIGKSTMVAWLILLSLIHI